MKKSIFILLICSALVSFSQTKGEVTYRIEIKKDSLEEPYANPENTDIKNEVLVMMHEAQPVNGYLVFNDSISRYVVEPKNEIPSWNNSNNIINIERSGINLNWYMAGGNHIYYNDFSRNYSISQNDLMGSTKRIKKESKSWIFSKETKNIDGYTCHLAFLGTDKKKKMKFWYTKEIIIKHGPKDFDGLPGLILEIDDFRYKWEVTKIDFDSKMADDIKEPVEEDLITEAEFRKWGSGFFKED